MRVSVWPVIKKLLTSRRLLECAVEAIGFTASWEWVHCMKQKHACNKFSPLSRSFFRIFAENGCKQTGTLINMAEANARLQLWTEICFRSCWSRSFARKKSITLAARSNKQVALLNLRFSFGSTEDQCRADIDKAASMSCLHHHPRLERFQLKFLENSSSHYKLRTLMSVKSDWVGCPRWMKKEKSAASFI